MLEKSYNYIWSNKKRSLSLLFYCCDLIRINNAIGIKIIPKNHGKCANTNATILLITSAMPHPAKMDMVTAEVKINADKNTVHRCFDIFFLASLEDFMCSSFSIFLSRDFTWSCLSWMSLSRSFFFLLCSDINSFKASS